MKTKPPIKDSTAEFEHMLDNGKQQVYIFKLYVTGKRPQSLRAIENIKDICDKYLKGCYTLEVIDLYQQPQHAAIDQVVAVPMLLKEQPLPVRRFVGDLSDTKRLLQGLRLNNKTREQCVS
ncbi:MAG: circadian clock KaiB family protein [Deltaproteobacteria bacterium]|nr:circadian clock KaiB family protein [Deltaproteobacteria bacterium]